MTEEDARDWIVARFGPAAVDRLAAFAAMVRDESERQNLVSVSTLDRLWSRHLVDSAQLVALAPAAGDWLDIGSGGGFPGLVVALLRPTRMLLVEPRRLRAAFLAGCADRLGLSHVTVVTTRVERCTAVAAVISARAVASVEKLLHAAGHCATVTTRWLLPRGQLDPAELDRVREHWAGVFHVEQSVTDPGSVILIANGMTPR